VATEILKRRLAAIVFADVAGYSRLMERDEAGTHARLRELRQDVLDPTIAEHGGRIVHTAGDGMLLEFASASSALRCAIDVQRELHRRNGGRAPDSRIDFRIGINLGDIIIDGDEIAGDGVNVAARLETLAEPGGICLSASVREQLHDDMGVLYEDIGEQHVKNIERPIRVFSVAPFGERTAPRPRVATPAVRPALSVRVASFAAPHGDDRASEFAQSLARDLAARLGRGGSYAEWGLRAHVVASRRADLPGHAAEQSGGERYLLEGDVANSGYAYAVNLRLVDAETGAQVWSEREMLQPSDLASESGARLRNLSWRARMALIRAETQRVVASPAGSSSAVELLLRARPILREDTLEKTVEARALVEQALGIDPNLAAALMARATIATVEREIDPTPDYGHLAREMDWCTERVVRLEPNDPIHWAMRANALMLLGRWIAALEANAMASKLDPHTPRYFVDRAWLMIRIGRPAEAFPLVEHALTLEPAHGWGPMCAACMAHLLLGQNAAAIAAGEKASGTLSSWESQLLLAGAYANGSDQNRAAAARDEVLRARPWYTVARVRASEEPAHPDYLPLAEKYWYEGLRKAGFPER
jgi:class 3 adenylate cyclase/tetratricopeptide (TPR) repeat protein